jgi:hypothetical protein
MDCDKILVMSAGSVAEFDSPHIAGVRAPLFGVFAPFVRGVLVPLVLTRPASVAKLLTFFILHDWLSWILYKRALGVNRCIPKPLMSALKGLFAPHCRSPGTALRRLCSVCPGRVGPASLDKTCLGVLQLIPFSYCMTGCLGSFISERSV